MQVKVQALVLARDPNQAQGRAQESDLSLRLALLPNQEKEVHQTGLNLLKLDIKWLTQVQAVLMDQEVALDLNRAVDQAQVLAQLMDQVLNHRHPALGLAQAIGRARLAHRDIKPLAPAPDLVQAPMVLEHNLAAALELVQTPARTQGPPTPQKETVGLVLALSRNLEHAEMAPVGQDQVHLHQDIKWLAPLPLLVQVMDLAHNLDPPVLDPLVLLQDPPRELDLGKEVLPVLGVQISQEYQDRLQALVQTIAGQVLNPSEGLRPEPVLELDPSQM